MKRGIRLRQNLLISVVLIAVLFLMPLAVIVPFQSELHVAMEENEPESESDFLPTAQEGPAETMLKVLQEGTVQEMKLEDYLLGVLRAEMPASFEPEALKAQAVAARTYTVYNLVNGGRHGEEADICTDSTCCQAYLSQEQAAERWGEQAAHFEGKLEKAVKETEGQVLFYGDAPILAAFHSSSSGLTRAADEVWSTDLPYLKPVSSMERGESVPNYYSRVEISKAQFREKVSAVYTQADFSGSAENWLKNADTDEAGNVRTVDVGGVRLRGSELRAILNLRSACFTWEVQGEKLTFFVTGYGHGVGLSQYGANQMAAEGADYEEILTHYYTGAAIQTWQKG